MLLTACCSAGTQLDAPSQRGPDASHVPHLDAYSAPKPHVPTIEFDGVLKRIEHTEPHMEGTLTKTLFFRPVEFRRGFIETGGMFVLPVRFTLAIAKDPTSELTMGAKYRVTCVPVCVGVGEGQCWVTGVDLHRP
jgi:hypothetical protein